jgi:dipeptidyl aminopeptidase/acylaminoacyl peptidase
MFSIEPSEDPAYDAQYFVGVLTASPPLQTLGDNLKIKKKRVVMVRALGRLVLYGIVVAGFAARIAAAADPSWSTVVAPLRFITSGVGFSDYWPVFSPDGKDVLFSRSGDGKTWELFIVGVDGGHPRKFVTAPLSVSATRADWSSKLAPIAFTGGCRIEGQCLDHQRGRHPPTSVAVDRAARSSVLPVVVPGREANRGHGW